MAAAGGRGCWSFLSEAPRACHALSVTLYMCQRVHAAAATFFSSATKCCQVPGLILGPALPALSAVRWTGEALSKQAG